MLLRYTLLALLAIPLVVGAQQLPTFSSADNKQSYYIRFNNNTVLTDTGADTDLLNQTATEGNLAQLWTLTGRQDSCVVTARTGRTLYYAQSENRFRASTTDFMPMKLVANDAGKMELQIRDESLAPQSAPEAPTEVSFTGIAARPADTLSLWYSRPATDYTREALPI